MGARLAAIGALLIVAGATAPSHGQDGPPHGGAGGPRRPGGRMPGRTFISPMGEPFRGEPDGRTPAAAWFAGADADHDGRLTRAEFEADALRFFALLDVDRDGEIGPAELDRYEQEIAPEVSGGSFEGGGRTGGGGRRKGGHGGGRGGGISGGGGRGGGGDASGGEEEGHAGGPTEPALQGAARFGYLGLPEPVIAADSDFNRGVSRAEFVAAARARFTLLDADGDGVLTEAELPRIGGARR